MVDRIGYDDEARAAATARAGAGAKSIKFTDYVKDATPKLGTANIAIVEAAGEIRDGTAKTSWLTASSGIASDDEHDRWIPTRRTASANRSPTARSCCS